MTKSPHCGGQCFILFLKELESRTQTLYVQYIETRILCMFRFTHKYALLYAFFHTQKHTHMLS